MPKTASTLSQADLTNYPRYPIYHPKDAKVRNKTSQKWAYRKDESYKTYKHSFITRMNTTCEHPRNLNLLRWFDFVLKFCYGWGARQFISFLKMIIGSLRRFAHCVHAQTKRSALFPTNFDPNFFPFLTCGKSWYLSTSSHKYVR